jgi:AraC-like DNA-binding protein
VHGAGSALNAATDLQLAITRLCSVKQVKVGKVTAKLDSVFVTNLQRAADRRATKRIEEEEEAFRKIAKKGVQFNNALEEPLAQTVGELLAHIMEAMGNAVGVSREYLKRQFNGRLMRAEKDAFAYPSIGIKFRTNNKKKKLKLTPSDNQNDLQYLQELVADDESRFAPWCS